MNRPTLAGMTDRSACGRTMNRFVCDGAEAERLRRLDLAAGDRLQAAAHVLGDVGRREEGDAAHRARHPVEPPLAGQEQRQHDVGQEQDRDQRHAADDLDVGGAQDPDRRQLAAAPERQQHAEREREEDADRREQERQQQAAPQVRADRREQRPAPMPAAAAGTRPAATAASRWRSARRGTRPRSPTTNPSHDQGRVERQRGCRHDARAARRAQRREQQLAGRERDGQRARRPPVDAGREPAEHREERQAQPDPPRLVGGILADQEQAQVLRDHAPAGLGHGPLADAGAAATTSSGAEQRPWSGRCRQAGEQVLRAASPADPTDRDRRRQRLGRRSRGHRSSTWTRRL